MGKSLSVARLLRKLLRPLGKLLHPLAKLLRPLAKLLRPRSLPGRLADAAIPERLRSGASPSEQRDKKSEAPHEADLPTALTQADGLPIQRATLVGVPVEIAYNQFTQLEAFPDYMRAVAKVDQIDAAQADFELRRWGLRRRWTAHIVDQRPDERIAWRSVDGANLAGVTTFHSISDRLTRVDVSVVVEPSTLLDRIARRLGLVDRLIAGELRRFKAFVEMREEETGAWRGYIADGEVVDENEYFGWERDEEPSDEEPPEQEDSSQGRSERTADGKDAWGRGKATNGGSAGKSGGKSPARTRSRGKTGGSRSRA